MSEETVAQALSGLGVPLQQQYGAYGFAFDRIRRLIREGEQRALLIDELLQRGYAQEADAIGRQLHVTRNGVAYPPLGVRTWRPRPQVPLASLRERLARWLAPWAVRP